MGRLPRVLTIAGSDSGGGAGIQADLKTITVLGGFGMSAVTALTAQNTTGVQGIFEVDRDFVAKQIDSVLTDIGADAVKTGMLSRAEVIQVVAEKIQAWRIEKLVVDPVMVAKGGASLLQADAKDLLVSKLLPLAYVLTPNIPEAEELAEIKIETPQHMKEAAQAIKRLGPRYVLVKGGHLTAAAGEMIDILYDGSTFTAYAGERIATRDTHGTGCTYAAAIATLLAQGKPVREAVEKAKEYLTAAIRSSLRLGAGSGPTNHLAPLIQELTRFRQLKALQDAYDTLAKEPCGHLIPEVQSNLGYALPDARDPNDVAAFPGRIVRLGEGVARVAGPAYGASSHIARIILTVKGFAGDYLSAMNIRCSEEIIGACGELGYAVEHFSRDAEPPETAAREGGTLEWGTAEVLKKTGTTPDMIYDLGAKGKEPMIRVLGREPQEVVQKILNISREIRR